MPRDWENEDLPQDWLSVAKVIAALERERDYLQSKNGELTVDLKQATEQLERHKNVLKMQASAIDRLNATVDDLKESLRITRQDSYVEDGKVTSLVKDKEDLLVDNESLRFKLRTICDTVNKYAEGV